MAQNEERSDPEVRTKSTPTRRWENSANWRVKQPEGTEAKQDEGGNNRRQFAYNSPNSRTPRDNQDRDRIQTSNPSTPTKTPLRTDNSNSGSPSATPAAFTEGRRLYVGNMPYMAKQKDVEDLFASSGSAYTIERIDISIDPFTGRNPSYCFVDLGSKEQADKAMEELNGKDMLGRPVKIKPGVPKSNRDPPFGRRDPNNPNATQPRRFLFERWERDDAQSHWYNYSETGRRVFVGGLPRMPDQPTADYEIRKLFYGFKIEAISKVISPYRNKTRPPPPGNHYFLFVDLETAEEADAAIAALNGVSAVWGSRVHINKARGNSFKPNEREEFLKERQKPANEGPPPRSRWGPPSGFEKDAEAPSGPASREESPS